MLCLISLSKNWWEALPNAAIGVGNAGTITGIVGAPRQIQFGLKLVF